MAEQIENTSVTEILAYAKNPRAHTAPQIEAIAASIKRFGFTAPILVSADKEIIAGHGRFEAAQFLGLDEVPTICLENLTEDEVKAYRVIDNKLSDLSQWDDLLLASELEATDFDWSKFGFTDDEINGYERPDTDDSELLAAIKVTIDDPTTKLEPGQVLELGRHTLVCQDVINDWPDWMPLLKEGMLLVTYAGPFVVMTEKAAAKPMLIVQPDPVICGHIADTYYEIHNAQD